MPGRAAARPLMGCSRRDGSAAHRNRQFPSPVRTSSLSGCHGSLPAGMYGCCAGTGGCPPFDGMLPPGCIRCQAGKSVPSALSGHFPIQLPVWKSFSPPRRSGFGAGEGSANGKTPSSSPTLFRAAAAECPTTPAAARRAAAVPVRTFSHPAAGVEILSAAGVFRFWGGGRVRQWEDAFVLPNPLQGRSSRMPDHTSSSPKSSRSPRPPIFRRRRAPASAPASPAGRSPAASRGSTHPDRK